MFKTIKEANAFYNTMMRTTMRDIFKDSPKILGVDWAKDSGMNRGDIIARDGNVITIRFKTVTF